MNPATATKRLHRRQRGHLTAEEIPARLLYPIDEAMVLLSLSRSVVYEQIRAGRLRSVKQGRTRLIPASAIRDYVALLEHEAQEDSSGQAA